MDRLFVPLITVDIQPRKNAERPAIEMTTRTCQCPPYEVALMKHKWGVHAETVTERPMSANVNPLYELLPRMGLSIIDAEEKRLTEKYGKTIFFQVYRAGELREKIEACAKESNEFLERAKDRAAELEMTAAEKAAEALHKATVTAVAKAEAKRGPGRPRKNPTQEPAAADA